MARDITQLHPEAQRLALLLVEKCKEQGLIIKITDCVRSKAEQDALYAQGRTKPGSIVTNVKYPNSRHNWGDAFDFCRNDGKGAYYDKDGFFAKVGKIGKSLGLEWGGDWKSIVDKPHFQLKGWGSTCSKLKAKYGTPDKYRATWSDAKVNENTEKGGGYMFKPETVEKGSEGASVVLMQTLLKGKGYRGKNGKPLSIDGKSGANSVYAINAYQTARRKQGVELGTNGKNDSTCGSKMWADLIGL